MTVREKTLEINKLATIADRKARVAERLRGELIVAESDYRAAVAIWREAMAEAGPALLDLPVPPPGDSEAEADSE